MGKETDWTRDSGAGWWAWASPSVNSADIAPVQPAAAFGWLLKAGSKKQEVAGGRYE